MFRSRNIHWLCLLLFVAPRTHAQTAAPEVPSRDAFAALYKAVDGYLNTGKEHQRFTFTMLKQGTTSNENGKVIGRINEKFEMIYIGGLPYVRLIEQNGKPLSGNAAKKEQERYEQALNDHAGMSMGKWIKMQRGRSYGYHLPLEDLKQKFSTHFIGSELVDGLTLLHFHLATVSDAMDEPHPVAAQEIDLWIDLRNQTLAKASYKLLVEEDNLLAGTSGVADFFLVDGVLCGKHDSVHYVIPGHGSSKEFIDGDTIFSDYKKFTTTVKILTGTEEPQP